MGNFSPFDQDEFKKQPKCTIRDCQNFVDPCNFINKAISHTPEVEIHKRPKLYHFGRYLVKAKLFCRKCFVPVTGMECSYGKIFIPVTEISVAKTEISVTGLSYEHIDIFTKKRVARRDRGNRTSPVDQAYMKRPLVSRDCFQNFRRAPSPFK